MNHEWINQLYDYIKTKLKDFDDKAIEDTIKNHLINFSLMNDKGVWLENKLDIKEFENINKTALIEFVGVMLSVAAKNNYLNNNFGKFKQKDLLFLKNKLESDDDIHVLCYLICWAFVLNKLTKIIANNFSLIKIFKNKVNKYTFKFGFFKVIKFFSIRFIVNKTLRNFEKSGHFSKKPRIPIAINILEAVARDSVFGNGDNAFAGWLISIDALKTKDISKKWANLYVTWNLDFCTSIPEFPYNFCKIIIPEVNDYESNPNEFLYRRTIALYLQEIYCAYFQKVNWNDPTFTKLWGKMNRVCADEYSSEEPK